MTNTSTRLEAKQLNTQYLLPGSIALLMASLTLSLYFMSVAQFLLVFFWLSNGFTFDQHFTSRSSHNLLQRSLKFIAFYGILIFKNLISKLREFSGNKPALIFSSIYFMHVLGLLYTSDINNGLCDLRIKLPLLILPLIFSTMTPINTNQLKFLLLIYISAITVNTLISTWVLIFGNVVDTRDISIFIFHIRFSLNICLAIFILVYFLYRRESLFGIPKLLLVLVLVWLVIFLFLLKSLSGIMIFILISLYLIGALISETSALRIKVLLFVLLLAIPGFFATYTYSVVKSYITPETLHFDTIATHTASGNPYQHDTVHLGIENGRYVGLYISWEELETAWNERSKINFSDLDNNGNQISYTIIRYLHSKHLRKDASGVKALDDTDVSNIENGVANIAYLKRFSLKGKIYEAIMGYQNLFLKNDPNANSFSQRIEHWKASIHIIRKHLFTGVGTGDIDLAFNDAYKEMNSRLEDQWRLGAHNQFFTIMAGFGLFGLIWFVFSILFPVIALKQHRSFLFMVFIMIALLSMLVDDTLKSQAGVTFFACFYSLLLFGSKNTQERNTKNITQQHSF